MVPTPDEDTEVSRADAVLALIPASMVVALAGALALPLSMGTALAVGSVPATGTIGYALFYDPPAMDG